MSSSYISEELRAKIRTQANDQCGYCRSLQKYVLGILEIEHIIPKALGGSDNEENLWLACRLCNNFCMSSNSRYRPNNKSQSPTI